MTSALHVLARLALSASVTLTACHRYAPELPPTRENLVAKRVQLTLRDSTRVELVGLALSRDSVVGRLVGSKQTRSAPMNDIASIQQWRSNPEGTFIVVFSTFVMLVMALYVSMGGLGPNS